MELESPQQRPDLRAIAEVRDYEPRANATIASNQKRGQHWQEPHAVALEMSKV